MTSKIEEEKPGCQILDIGQLHIIEAPVSGQIKG